MKKKIKFPKKTVTVDVAEDLGMVDYPGVEFVVWEDPSRMVVARLMRAVIWTELQSDEDMREFFDAVSKFIIDCNIEGISFDTEEDVEEAFQSTEVSWGFMFETIVLLVARLLEKNEQIKKGLLALFGNQDSGTSNASEEEE